MAFSLVGGFSPTSVETENVFIKTYEGKLIAGTVLYNEASVHVYDTTTSATRSIKNMEIRIDEDGKNADDVKTGYKRRGFYIFRPKMQNLWIRFIKSILDRQGWYRKYDGLAKYLVENKIKPKNTINFFISNYEEIGHGSSLSRKYQFFAVDICLGVGQTSDAKSSNNMCDGLFDTLWLRYEK